MFHNFVGVNFLGKLHNTRQHLQFIKFIKDDIVLPAEILSVFLTSFSNMDGCERKSLLPSKKEMIKKEFEECDWYLFEICSLKLYKKCGYEVQFELTHDYDPVLQTEQELLEDLRLLRDSIPSDKNILFQIHFRPNVIYNDVDRTIEKREMIHDSVRHFCESNKNTFMYDPSALLTSNHGLFDGDTHFTKRGYVESFDYIYKNFFTK
jgi:hypothetical protein